MVWQSWVIQHRKQIIRGFQLVYAVILIIWLWGSWEVYRGSVRWYEWAILAGKSAIVVYILTLLPGMAGRYGIRHPILQVLMMFRRYVGISTFLLVLTHLSWVWLVSVFANIAESNLKEWWSALVFPLFMICGLLAASLLFLMFLTSNDLAVRKLGVWWKRVHMVTYVVVWLVFLHTMLQRWSWWSILIGIAAVLELGSFGWSWWKKHRTLNAELRIKN